MLNIDCGKQVEKRMAEKLQFHSHDALGHMNMAEGYFMGKLVTLSTNNPLGSWFMSHALR